MNLYIEKFGLNFSGFLEKQGDRIREVGNEFFDEYPLYTNFLCIIIQPADLNMNKEDAIDEIIGEVIAQFLTELAREEGHIAPDENLADYFESIRE